MLWLAVEHEVAEELGRRPERMPSTSNKQRPEQRIRQKSFPEVRHTASLALLVVSPERGVEVEADPDALFVAKSIRVLCLKEKREIYIGNNAPNSARAKQPPCQAMSDSFKENNSRMDSTI